MEKIKFDEILIERFDFSNKSNPLLDELISCYQEVFSDSPWHEWKKCLICTRSYGKKDLHVLEIQRYICCGEKVNDF